MGVHVVHVGILRLLLVLSRHVDQNVEAAEIGIARNYSRDLLILEK
jgi:hypothetical protein